MKMTLPDDAIAYTIFFEMGTNSFDFLENFAEVLGWPLR
jgi:hypothetical protein